MQLTDQNSVDDMRGDTNLFARLDIFKDGRWAIWTEYIILNSSWQYKIYREHQNCVTEIPGGYPDFGEIE